MKKIPYNVEQRKRTYRVLGEILKRLERDDAAVASRDVRPDGYTGSSNGSGRRSGHGDPTYSIVVQILGGEATGSLVEQYFGLIHQVAVRLEEIDSRRAGLLPPKSRDLGEEYCESCFRLIQVDHKGRRRRVCNPREGSSRFCWFCKGWIGEHKAWPPIKLLERREKPEKITNKVIAEVMGEMHGREAG